MVREASADKLSVELLLVTLLLVNVTPADGLPKFSVSALLVSTETVPPIVPDPVTVNVRPLAAVIVLEELPVRVMLPDVASRDNDPEDPDKSIRLLLEEVAVIVAAAVMESAAIELSVVPIVRVDEPWVMVTFEETMLSPTAPVPRVKEMGPVLFMVLEVEPLTVAAPVVVRVIPPLAVRVLFSVIEPAVESVDDRLTLPVPRLMALLIVIVPAPDTLRELGVEPRVKVEPWATVMLDDAVLKVILAVPRLRATVPVLFIVPVLNEPAPLVVKVIPPLAVSVLVPLRDIALVLVLVVVNWIVPVDVPPTLIGLATVMVPAVEICRLLIKLVGVAKVSVVPLPIVISLEAVPRLILAEP